MIPCISIYFVDYADKRPACYVARLTWIPTAFYLYLIPIGVEGPEWPSAPPLPTKELLDRISWSASDPTIGRV